MVEENALEELEQEPETSVVEEEEGKEEVKEGEEKKEAPKENRYSKRVKTLNANWREEQRKNLALTKENEELKAANNLKSKPNPDDYEDNPEALQADNKKWDDQERSKIRKEERESLRQEHEENVQKEKIAKSEKEYVKARSPYIKEDPNFRNYEVEIDNAVSEYEGAWKIKALILQKPKIGLEIVKHFGKNPDALLKIASSSPSSIDFKMGQLTAQLQAKPVKKSSSAPDPTRSEKGSAKKVTVAKNAPRGKNETHLEYAKRSNGL